MASFEAMSASTVSISVSASSQVVQVQNFNGCNQIRVFNNGTATVWIDFGGSGVTTSSTTGIPVPAGAVEVFSAAATSSGTVYAAAIAAGSTGSVYFTPGFGI